jgi:hypothetical protein
MWRLHFLSPLACAALACGIMAWRRPVQLVALGLAVGIALMPMLPQRPEPGGAIALGELLFANPQFRDRAGFYDATNPLVVTLPAGAGLARRLRLARGAYVVQVDATGRIDVALDDRPIVSRDGSGGRVTVDGPVHRLRVTAPHGGELRGLRVVPASSS